jgi:fructosamine-3-kinase
VQAFYRDVLKAVNDQCDRKHVLSRASNTAGGDINQAVILQCDSASLFVKYNHSEPGGMFAAEAAALAEIEATGTLRVPGVLAAGRSGSIGFLALEYLPLARGGSAQSDARLGQQLAALHRIRMPFFGWQRDNTIGSTPQLNPAGEDWIDFYGQHRLGFQADRLARQTGRTDIQEACRGLIDVLDGFFDDYQPQASLLHGDLWGGNHGQLADDTPVVFDPASYYGDRETDLAMTELFGGFSGEFYSAYQNSWPLDPGYDRRKPLYQLYHILNHANLFGGGYINQSLNLIKRLTTL